jgi:hypothetical protein
MVRRFNLTKEKIATLYVQPDRVCGDRQFFDYQFFLNSRLLFDGSDFSTPLNPSDDRVIKDLLGFLTLKPGDTDDEYFSSYTEAQMEWANSFACGVLACEIAE